MSEVNSDHKGVGDIQVNAAIKKMLSSFRLALASKWMQTGPKSVEPTSLTLGSGLSCDRRLIVCRT